MPLDPGLAAGIQAGASMATMGANAFLQTKASILQRQWNLQDYNRQRKDALADWQMQADYNSPAAQMQRLRDAKLNPNLVYGNGATATMGAPVRSSSLAESHYVPPKVDLASGAAQAIQAYQDASIQKVQMDNMEKQGILLDQQAKNLAAQEFKIFADTANAQSRTTGQNIKNQYAPAIAEMSLEGAQQAINKSIADTNYTIAKTGIAVEQNERQWLTTNMSLKVAAETILNKRAERLRMQWQNLESRSRISVQGEQESNLRWQREKLKSEILNVDQMRENLKKNANMTDEQIRLLQEKPGYWTEQAVSTLSNILQGLSKGFPSKNAKGRSSSSNRTNIGRQYDQGTGRYFDPETGEVLQEFDY